MPAALQKLPFPSAVDAVEGAEHLSNNRLQLTTHQLGIRIGPCLSILIFIVIFKTSAIY